MILKFWTSTQCNKISELKIKYQLPQEVINEIYRVVNILDTYYGSERDIDREDGGYLLLLTESIDNNKFFEELLDKYHVKAEDAELDDTLCIKDGIIWKSTLYLVSNDYGITFIYPCRDKEK